MAIGLGGVGAATAAVLRPAAEPAKTAAAPGDADRKGYRISAHIRKYYQTTRV